MRQIVETVVGLCVVLLTGALLFYAYAMQGDRNIGYKLRASVSDVAGLSSGADVCMAGVKIGVVSEVSVDPKTSRAVLILSLREDIVLPVDTALAVESASLLGGKFISLTPGSETETLKPEDEISLTTGAMSLEKMLLTAFMQNKS